MIKYISKGSHFFKAVYMRYHLKKILFAVLLCLIHRNSLTLKSVKILFTHIALRSIKYWHMCAIFMTVVVELMINTF